MKSNGTPDIVNRPGVAPEMSPLGLAEVFSFTDTTSNAGGWANTPMAAIATPRTARAERKRFMNADAFGEAYAFAGSPGNNNGALTVTRCRALRSRNPQGTSRRGNTTPCRREWRAVRTTSAR